MPRKALKRAAKPRRTAKATKGPPFVLGPIKGFLSYLSALKRLEQATALLRELEWAAGEWDDECPICHWYKSGEHFPKCSLVEFLSHDQG
jgi:hypothetical protein